MKPPITDIRGTTCLSSRTFHCAGAKRVTDHDEVDVGIPGVADKISHDATGTGEHRIR